jgi:hypothetical protein
MAEYKTPPITRSSHKPLEYTSCIDTTLSSSTPISTCGNINTHSSFDSISQPRDCDSLVTNNHTRQHQILERDLRRFDIPTNTHTREIYNKRLDRIESISLPTTPIGHSSSKFNHKCHPLLLKQAANNIIDADDDDDDDEKPSYRFTSSTDYMLATPEQLPDDPILNSKR